MTHTLARRRLVAATAASVVVASIAGASFGADAAAPGRADWTAIQTVIDEQLAALAAGDGERAFGYASDGIREQVGDARAFMAMVRSGYADLLGARYREYLEGAVVDGVVIQPLRLVAPDNTVRVALYTMQKDRARWRIAGCVIAPSTVRAA